MKLSFFNKEWYSYCFSVFYIMTIWKSLRYVKISILHKISRYYNHPCISLCIVMTYDINIYQLYSMILKELYRVKIWLSMIWLSKS